MFSSKNSPAAVHTTVFLMCAAFYLLGLAHCGNVPSVTLGNDYFKYVIQQNGKNLHFIDNQSGKDYLDAGKESYCASITAQGKEYNASAVTYDGKQLIIKFGESEVTATINTVVTANTIRLEVLSVAGGEIESLNFVNVPLILAGKPADPFAACALSMNLFTNVPELPALQTKLWAACYERFGITGATVVLAGAPVSEILSVIKTVFDDAPDLPPSKIGGPWAKEVSTNYGSYLFNFGTLTEENVDEWIGMVKSLGFNQIDSHGGGSRFFRFGDFYLNPEKWPKQWNNFKAINKKLHDAGIGAILHTYAFFIDKRAKYVTPVPHPDLGAFRSFTLAKPLSRNATEIEVEESTAEISNKTGFFVRNSVTLHVGDELITFKDVTKEAPYKFIGCERGAYGTKASAHDNGAKARHLKECFGLFAPDPETALFEEVARQHAEIANNCDFDGMYIDAIDGSDILGGGEHAWYYGQKFIFDIWKYLKKDVGLEMSSMWHHIWKLRTRWQAWDYPTRGHKRFIDVHAETVNGGLLLPLHLGWWNFLTWDPPQTEPTYPDVIEYLGCKLIGFDAGISLTGAINKENLKKNPAFQRLVGILKQYEDLRHANYFDESIKEKLREPGKDFTLFQDQDGKWRFKPALYATHKAQNIGNESASWKMENSYETQPAKLRIEALMSAGSYEAAGNITLDDFADVDEFKAKRSAEGVDFQFESSGEQLKTGNSSLKMSAKNSGKVAQRGAWTMAEKKFDPPLDLSKHQALGVWIYGDGQGEIVNFRLQSPHHITGAFADHFVVVDFTGWRYIELIETESTRYDEYIWQRGEGGFGGYYVYREAIQFKTVETLSIWFNNLPANKNVTCFISPVKAMPMVSAKLVNPSVIINGGRLMFPAEMESGSYLEFYSSSDCKLYGPNGELLADIRLAGEIPDVPSGANEIQFSVDNGSDTNVRANVTVITYGDVLQQ